MSFKVGDIVKHKASFLKSCGWYTNVPVNGKVVAIEDPARLGIGCVQVDWSDGSASRPIRESDILLAKDPDYSGM
jgi:hypothetical protein